MRPQCNSGFSLIEVMCAILILGVALAGLTQGISTALGSSKENEVQTAAALLAAAQIDTLRAERDISDGESDGDCSTNFPSYHWKQTITSTDISGLHEVKVSIESTNNGTTIYELKTLLFDPNSITDTSDTKKSSSKSTTPVRRRERRQE